MESPLAECQWIDLHGRYPSSLCELELAGLIIHATIIHEAESLQLHSQSASSMRLHMDRTVARGDNGSIMRLPLKNL